MCGPYFQFSLLRPSFFYFCFTDFFRNKFGSVGEIKIKIIWTIFQSNSNRRPSILTQLENGPNEFYFEFNQPGCSRKDKTKNIIEHQYCTGMSRREIQK